MQALTTRDSSSTVRTCTTASATSAVPEMSVEPGGIMLMDGGAAKPNDPYVELMMNWFGMNVNEPFSAGFKALDYPQAVAEAGFAPERYFTAQREPVYLKGQLPPISFFGALRA